MKKSTLSVAAVVTNRVIAALQSGAKLPWIKPWKSSGVGVPFNPCSKTEYRGINFLMLSMFHGCNSQFLTFNQAKAMGGHVKKGSTGNPVFFFGYGEEKSTELKDSKTQDAKTSKYSFTRTYPVFNVNDIEGIDLVKSEPRDIIINDFADEIISRSGVKLNVGTEAFYRPSTHEVTMPKRESFISDDYYYSVYFHELVHSTATHLGRTLDRTEEPKAFEELVAELGASMLCAVAGIDTFETDHTASYVQGWIKALGNDEKFIVKASQQAQKAVDFLLGKTFEKSEEVSA